MTVMNSEVKPDGVGHESIVTNSEIDGKDTSHLDVHYKIDAEGRSDFQDNENQNAKCIKVSKLTNYSESESSSEMEISDDNSEDHTYEARSDSDHESQEFTIEKTVHGHDVSMKIQREEVKVDIPVIDITDDNGMSNKPESEYTDIDRNEMNKRKSLNDNLDATIMGKSKDPVSKQPDEQNDSDKSEEKISNAGMNDGVTKTVSKKIDKQGNTDETECDCESRKNNAVSKKPNEQSDSDESEEEKSEVFTSGVHSDSDESEEEKSEAFTNGALSKSVLKKSHEPMNMYEAECEGSKNNGVSKQPTEQSDSDESEEENSKAFTNGAQTDSDESEEEKSEAFTNGALSKSVSKKSDEQTNMDETECEGSKNSGVLKQPDEHSVIQRTVSNVICKNTFA